MIDLHLHPCTLVLELQLTIRSIINGSNQPERECANQIQRGLYMSSRGVSHLAVVGLFTTNKSSPLCALLLSLGRRVPHSFGGTDCVCLKLHQFRDQRLQPGIIKCESPFELRAE